nr:hypothetical protein BaRGS_010182 [Batillaria attramentaria]
MILAFWDREVEDLRLEDNGLNLKPDMLEDKRLDLKPDAPEDNGLDLKPDMLEDNLLDSGIADGILPFRI